MASAKLKLTSLRYDKAGGTATLKQAQGFVRQTAQQLAANCNAIAQPVHGVQGKYVAREASLKHTAGAIVISDDVYAAIDNQRHNTIKKGCNV